MNKQDIKYIEKRLEWLTETADELKKSYKKNKIPVLEDLYLEIYCFVNQIKWRIRRIKNGNRKKI